MGTCKRLGASSATALRPSGRPTTSSTSTSTPTPRRTSRQPKVAARQARRGCGSGIAPANVVASPAGHLLHACRNESCTCLFKVANISSVGVGLVNSVSMCCKTTARPSASSPSACLPTHPPIDLTPPPPSAERCPFFLSHTSCYRRRRWSFQLARLRGMGGLACTVSS